VCECVQIRVSLKALDSVTFAHLPSPSVLKDNSEHLWEQLALPFSFRQEFLQEHFLFTCQCRQCTNEADVYR